MNMFSTNQGILSTLLLASIVAASLQAEVRLPAIFADHMVLQRSEATPVWGRANPGERVTVSLASVIASTHAGNDGRWTTMLNLSELSEGPYELSVVGQNRLSVNDVLIGEVWLASGQSNMAYRLRASQDKEAIDKPANDRIRFFTTERTARPDGPSDEVVGQWAVASPESRPKFSAVGYYFARKVQSELGVPVAIIHASWPGTNIDSWIATEAQRAVPQLARAIAPKLKAHREFPSLKQTWLDATRAWLSSNNREDIPPAPATIESFAVAPAKAGVDGWSSAKMPGMIDGDRVIWLRSEVTVSSHLAGTPLAVNFDEIVGIDSVYWDGKSIAGRTLDTFNGEGYRQRDSLREYSVPARLVTPGEHTLAVRLYAPAPWGKAGLGGSAISVGRRPVTDSWLVKTERTFPPLAPSARETAPAVLTAPLREYNVPGSLYNGMIHPLAPYGIRGFLWYQGENDAGNSGSAANYRESFPLLITKWRQLWGRDNLTFLWCQLPDYLEKTADAGAPSTWSELREAQTSALLLPRTGQAVLIDAGEPGDVHPRDKRVPGTRLAVLALGLEYGRHISYLSPRYKLISIEGNTVRVQFDHVGSGLVAPPLPASYLYKNGPKPDLRPLTPNSPGSEVEGFAIRGADGIWHWAEAAIDGHTVLVSSPAVPSPVAVRYAWANSPTFNLYNADGLPATPFRSDQK